MIFKKKKERKWEPVVQTEDHYESLETEVEQPSSTVEETMTDSDKAHAFLFRNQGVPISIRTISKAIGLQEYRVRKAIKELIEDEVIEKPSPTVGRGTVYTVTQRPNLSNVGDNPTPDDDKIMQTVVKTQEALVMDFIRETRSTDVLDYLNWLGGRRGL